MLGVRKPFKMGEILAVWVKSDGICAICHEPCAPDQASIDHIYPISLGGAHEIENWQLAHGRCNSAKGARLGWRTAQPAPPLTPSRFRPRGAFVSTGTDSGAGLASLPFRTMLAMNPDFIDRWLSKPLTESEATAMIASQEYQDDLCAAMAKAMDKQQPRVKAGLFELTI